MNKIIFCILYFVFYFLFLSACQSISKNSHSINLIEIEKDRVIRQADIFLKNKPLTITAFQCERSAGGIHDYYSEGDYWWPDADNPDGPYIRKDGMTNPDNFVKHRQLMRQFSIETAALTTAYIISGSKVYADHALNHLVAWFVNPETRMNPNLLYSQAIMGKVTGRGIGIIDTIHLIEVARSAKLLAKYGILDNENLSRIKEWFSEYLEWMTTHEFGLKERDNGNNHSTCWAMQVSAFSDFTGDIQKLSICHDFLVNELIPDQMDTVGSFPKEINRTKPYGYSIFNLDAMVMVCQILSLNDIDVWNYQTDEGKSMALAVEFLYPFIKDKSDWPYQKDVMYFDLWPVRQPFLLFAGLAYKNQEYLDLWKTLDPDPDVQEIIRNFPIRQPLLWIKI